MDLVILNNFFFFLPFSEISVFWLINLLLQSLGSNMNNKKKSIYTVCHFVDSNDWRVEISSKKKKRQKRVH